MNLSTLTTKPIESSPITQAIDDGFASLTDPQRYAMLMVRAGEAAAKLRAIMDAMSWPQPEDADWSALCRLSLVAWRLPRYRDELPYDLLPRGLTAAQTISRDLCRKLGVHVLTVRERRPGIARNGHCSCGLMRHTEIRGSDGSVENAYSHHLRQMAKDPGGFAAERRLQEIFDQVAQAGAESRARFHEASHA